MTNLKSFLKSQTGNVAFTFGIALVPIMVGAGAALDYSRQTMALSALQGAVDSAALAGGTQFNPTDTALKAEVTKYLVANGAEDLVPAIGTVSVTKPADSTIRVEAAGAIDATIMKILGYDKLEIHAAAEVKKSFGQLELALALDNTGSMSGGKLDALKTASKDLLDTVFASGLPDGSVKAAIVPFSEYVNVGMSNRYVSWMDVPPDSSTTSYQCWPTYPDATSSNCRPETYTYYQDGLPVTVTSTVCDWDYGNPVQECGNVTDNVTWSGCVGSRSYPLDTRDELPTTRYPGVPNATCPSEVTPLNSDKGFLKGKIDGMIATGNTYVPAGVMWGWNTLSKGEPYAQAADYSELNKGLTKALVIMTDGINTISPTYPKHDGWDTAKANQLTAELCDNVKSTGIIVYTVAFQVPDAATKDLLEACASASSYFFDAGDSAALQASFKTIADSLAKLHISK